MTNTTKADVSTGNLAYKRQQPKWHLLNQLKGGTDVMRAADTERLPKETEEEQPHYDTRLKHSFLRPAYSGAINLMTSKPFGKPVTIKGKDDLPKIIAAMLKNVDGSGRDMTEFARDVYYDGFDGLSHILPDLPLREISNSDLVNGTNPPRLVHIPAQDMLDGSKDEIDGIDKVTMIRYKGVSVERDPADPHTQKSVEWVKVIKAGPLVYTESGELIGHAPGTWEKYFKDGDGNWLAYPSESGEYDRADVPLRTHYTSRVGFLEAKPPKYALAELNLEDWQFGSDLKNAARHAMIGIYFGKGLPEKYRDKKFIISVHEKLFTGSKDADLKVVEHTGQGVKIGRDYRQDLIDEMETMGKESFTRRTGDVKATGIAINEKGKNSDVQAWITNLENKLTAAVLETAKWIGVEKEMPEDFKIEIYKDFKLDFLSSSDGELLLKLFETLSYATPNEVLITMLVDEFKRRGMIDDTVSPAKIAESIQAQGPNLALIGEDAA